MNDSNQTSQPATNYKENYLGENALAPQASIALHPSLTPKMPAGFAPEPVEQGERPKCFHTAMQADSTGKTHCMGCGEEILLFSAGAHPPAPSESKLPPPDGRTYIHCEKCERTHLPSGSCKEKLNPVLGTGRNTISHIIQREDELDTVHHENQQLRLQLEKLQKRFDSVCGHVAAISIALGTPVGMNSADYAAQLKLDNAQKAKRIAELEQWKKEVLNAAADSIQNAKEARDGKS